MLILMSRGLCVAAAASAVVVQRCKDGLAAVNQRRLQLTNAHFWSESSFFLGQFFLRFFFFVVSVAVASGEPPRSGIKREELCRGPFALCADAGGVRRMQGFGRALPSWRRPIQGRCVSRSWATQATGGNNKWPLANGFSSSFSLHLTVARSFFFFFVSRSFER